MSAFGGDAVCLHASAVAIAGKGLLILGASGAGKSTLALELIGRGASLVADDRTIIEWTGSQAILKCPPAISGRIEARFIGLLAAKPHSPVPLQLVVDLDRTETERLPPSREWRHDEITAPLLYRAPHSGFPAALQHYMLWGRYD